MMVILGIKKPPHSFDINLSKIATADQTEEILQSSFLKNDA